MTRRIVSIDLVGGRAGGEHGGDARSSSFGRRPAGDDAADHDRDVDAGFTHLLDDLRRQRHVGAREHRQPDGVDVLVDRGRRDRVGRLEQPGVDHLVAGVAQDAGDDLHAAVVAVEADLGHEHSLRSSSAHLRL